MRSICSNCRGWLKAHSVGTVRSTVGGVTRFNRWLSQSINPDEEQDPWNDLRGEANDLDEIKMAFDDDFHLTVIPNFLHDSDAYVANLENKLERLQQIKKNPSAKEMVAAVSRAKALRLKYAQMHPELNAKPPDESADDEDNGFLALLPMLFMPISRRFFPRLPLTKEEAQNLLKYDFLLMRHEAEMNNEVSATVEVEGYEIKDANTAPDTSWDQQQKDSGTDQPFITFDSPEANELQIPKNWASDDAHQEVHHSTVNTPDDTANITRVATNRSALSLSANTSPIPEASTITSFTPTRRSEDAFYHFAYIRTSMTSTTENTKAETPSDCPASLSNAGYTHGNSNSKTAPSNQTPFSSACSVELPYKQQSSFAPECNTPVETKGLSKSSANILDGPARDQVVPTTKSSPSLKVPKDAEANGLPKSADEDKQLQVTDEDNHRSERNIRAAASSDRADGNSSEGTMHEDSPASLKNDQGTISPEVTMASSSTKDSVNQTKSVLEAALERAPTGVKHSSQKLEPEVAEVTVASSMTHDSMGTGIEVPWLFEKESNMSLGGVDELEHMSSLVRASVDEDDEPPRADGNQASQMSAICTPMSSTCCYSDRTQTKASEGTSGNITTNYSDPHSNLFDEESLIKREEGHAPIIRMYSPFPRDIHVSLQGNLLSWALPRGAEQQHNREVAYPKLLSLPAVNSDASTHHNSPRLAPKGSKRDAPAASHQHAPTIVDRLYSDSSRPSFKARLSKDTKCRKATSTKSQRSREHSFASSASSMPSAAGSQIGEKLMQLSSGKLSTSSMFKNRQRSVHWFKVIEDVDSDTVVKDCDYMLTRQVKTKVPVKNKEEPAALKVTSKASKEQSESDRNEDSIVDKDCKKFAIRVLEEEVFIAGKVNSCLEFFEYSCTKMGGVLREQEDTAAAAKNRGTSISEIAKPMESLERHSQSTDLVTSKEFVDAVNEKEKTAVDTPELSELVEKQSKIEVTSKVLDDPVAVTEGVRLNVVLKNNTESLEVLSMTASSLTGDAEYPVATIDHDGKKTDADVNDVALLPESPSPESHQCKASSEQSWEHLEADVNLQLSCATGEVAVPCGMAAGTTSKAKSCNEPAEVLESTGEQKVLTLKQELEFAKVASDATATSSKFADVQDVSSSGQEDRRDDGKHEKNITTGFAKCATEPSPVSEMKAVEAAAKQDSCSTLSRDARRSPSHCSSDNKHAATSEEDKKKAVEIEDKENEGSYANRDTTVLQCHELAGTSRLSTFSASNKGVGLNGCVASNRGAEPNRAAAPNRAVEPVQRPFNMTRTLRITTTKQFKPLNLRRSITGILGSDSSLLGRSLSVQSREVMLPRTQKRPEKRKKPSATLKENGYTSSGSTRKSGSREDATVANNQELPPSDLTARRSYSVAEAHTRASLRGSAVAVRSKTQTIGRHSCTALGDTSELAKAIENETSLEYKENEGRVKNKCKTKVKKMSQSQLPLKKRSCSRRVENHDVQTKDLEGGPLPADCKTSSRVVETNANSAEGKGAEDLIANQEAPATWAATKPDALQGSEDVDSANPECTSEAAPEDRTISLIAESQYSALGGAEINNPTPITAILGGDTNVESVKHCQSLPSTYASTNSKDNLPLNDDTTVSATDPDENASVMEGDKSASVNFEHSTMSTCKPTPKCHQKKGGERDVDAEVNNSMTSSTSTASNTDAAEKEFLSVQSHSHHAVNNPLADYSQTGDTYRL